MFSSELKSRSNKFEKEQKERLQKERLHREQERLKNEQARQLVQRHEEEASRKRAAALAAQEIERQQHEEEVEHNNGVWWQASLAASTNDEAHEKGVKRASDKISLPASASRDLMAQDAPKNGTMFFEVSTPGGDRTHTGVLSFTAPEGGVGLPRQVVASLWPKGEIPSGERVTVTYRRLEKGTYARLQPETADFQKAAGGQMEEVLVDALSTRSAVSEGDWLPVEVTGTQFRLRVQQLRPTQQVSVIDTEMEAEVEPSIETEQRLKVEAEENRRREVEMERMAVAALAQKEAAEAKAAEEAARQEARAVKEAADWERIRQEKEASLPPEPPAGTQGCTTCLVRFPDGSRHARRFRHIDPLASVFQFVDAQGGSRQPPGSYSLVTQYPRRQFLDSFPGTLQEAGLLGQEALMLESLRDS